MHFDSNQWLTLIIALIAAAGPSGTAVFALITSNKRLDDVAHRLDRIERRLDSMDEKLSNVRERVIRLEERSGIIVSR